MCKRGNVTTVEVKIPADLSCDGKEKWKAARIDSCIATLIAALQTAGIDMRGSCCGHEKSEGVIQLQDGRALLILNKEYADLYYSCKDNKPTIYEFLEKICLRIKE